ncbi:hypothetical protein V8F20_012361 [Naviculisporaceae sp. PSN 640]
MDLGSLLPVLWAAVIAAIVDGVICPWVEQGSAPKMTLKLLRKILASIAARVVKQLINPPTTMQ